MLEGNGRTCNDINECDANPCDSMAKCTNSIGSFTCECLSGFTGDGQTCDNIDECDNGTHTCGKNTDCIDTGEM